MIRTLLLPLVLFLAIPGCSRSQEQQAGGTAGNTPAAVNQPAAVERKELEETLISARSRFGSQSGGADAHRLSNALYGSFHALVVMARTMDRAGSFTGMIDEEQSRFQREDSTRVGDAGKIVNGMSGVYSMYSLLYHMRFHNDEERMKILSEKHETVAGKMRSSTQAIEAVAAMAAAVYSLNREIMKNIDTENLYTDVFAQIQDQYERGVKSAVTDEDRFLNAIYRTFEVSQLWALFVDPASRARISGISSEFHKSHAGVEEIGTQMAVAAETLYRMLDLIAEKTIQVNY